MTPITADSDITFIYTKHVDAPEAAQGSVTYVDDTENGATLEHASFGGNVGDKINYTTNDRITFWKNRGYDLVGTDPFKDGEQTYDKDVKNNTFVIHLVHTTTHIDKDHAGHGYTVDDLQRTVTTKVKYVDESGKQLANPVNESVTFTASGDIDNVTGHWVTVKDGKITGQATGLTWNKTEEDWNAIPAQTIKGYDLQSISGTRDNGFTIDNKTGAISAQKVTPKSANTDITIVYAPHQDIPVATTGKLTYIDDTTGKDLSWVNFSGVAGNHIGYDALTQIKNYEAQGYDLVSDNYDLENGQTPVFDKDASKNVFEIHLKHATTPITPENPGKPGDKVPKDPKNPNEPEHKYPDSYVPQTLTKTITRDVTYVMADGSKAPTPVHQEVNFTGNGVLDLVTGGYVTVGKDGKLTPGKITWTQDKDGYDSVPAIDTTKYQITKVTESNTQANVDTKTGAVDGEKVTANNQNSKIVITLDKKPETPVTPAKDQGSLKVIFHDDTTGQDIPGYGMTISTTDVGTPVNYTPNSQITDLENKGYDYVSTDGTIPTAIVKGDTVVTIHVKHATTPITPENPGKPGDKVPKDPKNPNEPEHKYPDNYVPQTLTKTITRDITYVMSDGSKAPDPVHQTVTFNGNGVLDLVTGGYVTVDKDGKITPIGQITWTAANGDSFAATDPVANNGYKVIYVGGDKNNKADHTTGAVASDEVTPTSGDQSITIVLNKGTETPVVTTKTGTQTVHYVDENGNPIAPDTTNDSHTFTQINGTWTESGYQYKGGNVPVIPGYVATTKTFDGQKVTPDNPDATVTITYKKIGTIIPVDPSGKPIPGQSHPQFQNDPTDPTKVIDGQKPSVPGYEPQTGKVGDPVPPATDPSQDVKVPYTKSDDSVPTTGSITYIDETTGKTLKTEPLKGNVGEKITYISQDKINDYINKGYKLDTDKTNYHDGQETFQKDGNNYQVYLVHDTVTINPNTPGVKKGTKINPNDPDPNGPTWSADYNKTNLIKTGTQTVHYVGAGDQTPKDNVTKIEFDHELVFDKVTGDKLSDKWTPSDQTYEKITTPTVDGYTPDYTVVGGDTVNVNDENPNRGYTVIYTQNQSPVIPDIPTPTPTPQPSQATQASQASQPTEPEQPTLPDEPDDDDVPVTPHRHHHKKSNNNPRPTRPTTPSHWNDNFAPHSQSWNSNVTPHAQSTGYNDTVLPHGERVLPNGQVVNAKGQVIGYVDANGQVHYTLPQTGENNNEDVAALLAGGVAVSISLIGLAGVKKRRQRD